MTVDNKDYRNTKRCAAYKILQVKTADIKQLQQIASTSDRLCTTIEANCKIKMSYSSEVSDALCLPEQTIIMQHWKELIRRKKQSKRSL